MLSKACFAAPILLLCFESPLFHAQEAKPPAPMPLAPWLLHAKLKHQVDPEYPTVGYERRAEGDNFVNVVVNENGKVQTAEAVNCATCLVVLNDAAVEAVKEWEYEPTIVDGKRVPVSSWVAFRFRAREQPFIEILSSSQSTTPTAEPPAADAPQRIQAPATDLTRFRIFQVPLNYPLKARMNNVHGEVLIHCFIDRDGTITKADVVSGHPLLAPAAMECVKQWRFKPMGVNGHPVLVETTFTVRFVIGR